MRRGEWPVEYHFERSVFREIERPRHVAGRVPLPPGDRRGRESVEVAGVRRDPFTALDSYN